MLNISFCYYIYIKEFFGTLSQFNYQIFYVNSLYFNKLIFNNILLYLIIVLNFKKVDLFKLFFVSLYLFSFNLKYLNFFLLEEWPSTLLIGLNNIHPYVYYLSFLILLFTLNKNFFFCSCVSLKNLNFGLALALLLGMLWGSLNTVWGYFWVNDYIEIILLTFFIFSLLWLHIYNLKVYKIFFSLISVVVFNIYLLRIGFFSSRHSFFLNTQTASYCNYYVVIFGFITQSFKQLYSFVYIYILANTYFLLFLWQFYYFYSILYLYLKRFFILIFHLFTPMILITWVFCVSHHNLVYFYCNTHFVKFVEIFESIFYNSTNLLSCKITPLQSQQSILVTTSCNMYLSKLYVSFVFAAVTYAYFFTLIYFLPCLYFCV